MSLDAKCCRGAKLALPIVNVLIKSDRIHKKIPRLGQFVRIEGKTGLFFVVGVDKERRVADAMDRTGIHPMEENVPFAQIHTLNENVSEAVQRFLQMAQMADDTAH